MFLSLLPVKGYAQERSPEPERGSVLPGYIITLQGDTVKVDGPIKYYVWYFDEDKNKFGRMSSERKQMKKPLQSSI